MPRLPASAALAALFAAGLAAPLGTAQAQAAGFYVVELAQPASKDRAIAGGVEFRCEGTTCTAPRSRDRALRVCSELRRKVGTVARFSEGGTMLPAEHLARCNG